MTSEDLAGMAKSGLEVYTIKQESVGFFNCSRPSPYGYNIVIVA